MIVAPLALFVVPHVVDLVAQGHDVQPRSSTFFATLTTIAAANHWSADADRYEQGGTMARFSVGRAVAAGPDVLVILQTERVSIPGVEAAELLLVDTNGALLDKVGCEINSRYGRLEVRTPRTMEAAVFAVPDRPDDAYMGHTIAARGRSYTFHPDGDLHAESFSAPAIVNGRRSIELESRVSIDVHYRRPRPPAWSRKGLLQIAIANRKLDIPFPALGVDDSRLGDEPRPSVDELAPGAQDLARRLLPILAAHPLARGERAVLGFELHPDGSIAKLHVIDGSDAAPFYKAVHSAAPFGRFPLAVPEGVDVTASFDRERFRDGMSETAAADSKRWAVYMPAIEQRIGASWRASQATREVEGEISAWVEPDGSIVETKPWSVWSDPAAAAAAVAAVEHTIFAPLPGITWPVEFVISFVRDRGQQIRAGCNP